jgi:hypothetical protein
MPSHRRRWTLAAGMIAVLAITCAALATAPAAFVVDRHASVRADASAALTASGPSMGDLVARTVRAPRAYGIATLAGRVVSAERHGDVAHVATLTPGPTSRHALLRVLRL